MIVGKAAVVFGGKIQINVGMSDDGYVTIALSELIKPQKPGRKIDDGATHGEQVFLSFDSLDSLNVFRDALDIVELTLKNGTLPEDFGGFEIIEPKDKDHE